MVFDFRKVLIHCTDNFSLLHTMTSKHEGPRQKLLHSRLSYRYFRESLSLNWSTTWKMLLVKKVTSRQMMWIGIHKAGVCEKELPRRSTQRGFWDSAKLKRSYDNNMEILTLNLLVKLFSSSSQISSNSWPQWCCRKTLKQIRESTIC